MPDYKKEISFFHSISEQLLDYVLTAKDHSIAVDKGGGDYSTVIDIEAERQIVSALAEIFPNDEILAEEERPDSQIGLGRIWLIDPICGTNNLSKGMRTFCTNIALVEGGIVKAACVIDYIEQTYVWSAGDLPVYNGTQAYVSLPSHSVKIDIDFGSVRSIDNNLRVRHSKAIGYLVNNTLYDIVSLNTSLGFMYTAIGKIDGFICVYNHPWDIAAAGYLLQRQGGLITDLEGNAWTVTSVGAIGAINKEIHGVLTSSLKNDL